MIDISQLEMDIRVLVASCKGMTPQEIDPTLPLAEEIGLVGDDFMMIAREICRKFHVLSPNQIYTANMTIKDWARMISDKPMS